MDEIQFILSTSCENLLLDRFFVAPLLLPLDEKPSLIDEFINSFRCYARPLKTAIQTLEGFLRNCPDLVWLVQIDDDLEVHFQRALTILFLQKNNPTFNFTSFERGLKHAGMEVTQATHANPIKIWAKKKPTTIKEEVPLRKRTRRDDDDYHEMKK